MFEIGEVTGMPNLCRTQHVFVFASDANYNEPFDGQPCSCGRTNYVSFERRKWDARFTTTEIPQVLGHARS